MPEPEQHEAAVSPELHFRDPDAAARNLSHIRQLVPTQVYESLSALLLTAANPDVAVNQFERLAEMASPELLRLLEKHPALDASIRLRLPYIEPLNLLQVELLKRHRGGEKDPRVREGIHLSINAIATALRNSG